MRLYSAASSSSETFCLSSPSDATRSVCVPEASSVSLVEGSADEPSPEPEGPAAEPSELSRPPRSGSPRSVVIFTVPDSCCTSDAAIFSMSSCALIFGRSGSPESASAGTSPMVAAAMPTTVAGDVSRGLAAARGAQLFGVRGGRAVVGFVRCHVCLTSVVGGGCQLPCVHPVAAILTRIGEEWCFL